MIVDLYAGPGGWDLAARTLGLTTIGLELDPDACHTRANAQLPTIRTDIATYPTAPFRHVTGLIASPPCPAFSAAGKRQGDTHLDAILDAIDRHAWTDLRHLDPDIWLTLDLGRWITNLAPDWIAAEQVPGVLPIWRAYARQLDAAGYSTWTGILNAADYGVPQIRKRAILIASATRTVHPPAPTHTEPGETLTLFGALDPWVTMADALGSGARETLYGERDAGRWVSTGRDWKPDGTSQLIDAAAQPSPTLTAKSGGQWEIGTEDGDGIVRPVDWTRHRPATTVQGDPRIWPPGHRVNSDDERRLGTDEARRRYADRAGTDAIRIELEDALRLQTFPADYPVAGNKTSAFQQVGNAIPVDLAAAILATVVT